MSLHKYGLRIENDLEGFQQFRWMVKMCGCATLMYNTKTRRLMSLEGFQDAGTGSIVKLCYCVAADLPKVSVQLIYDRLAEAMEQRWELGWVNG